MTHYHQLAQFLAEVVFKDLAQRWEMRQWLVDVELPEQRAVFRFYWLSPVGLEVKMLGHMVDLWTLGDCRNDVPFFTGVMKHMVCNLESLMEQDDIVQFDGVGPENLGAKELWELQKYLNFGSHDQSHI